MYLLAPANPKEIADRILWFDSFEAKKAAEKGVKFGLEIKGNLSYLEKAPSCYFGVHLPYHFATEWYYQPKKRKNLLKLAKKIGKLKPNYAVLHGILIDYDPPPREYIHRYTAPSGGSEYFKLLRAYIKLVKELKKIIPIKIENIPLTLEYCTGNKCVPYTHIYSGTNRLNDLKYIRKKTGAEVVLDTEHLAITLNFLNRQKNYAKLPLEKIAKLTEEDRHFEKIFGFYLKKYFIPYVDKKIEIEDFIKKLKTKYYHLSGSFQDVVPGVRTATHGPIRPTKTFLRVLKAVLAQNPEAILVETANSTLGKTWKHLKKNETETSFRNMCSILSKEL